MRTIYPGDKSEDQWCNTRTYTGWEEQPQTPFLPIVNSKHVTKAAALV